MHLSHMFPTLLYYIITLSFKTKLKLNINNPLFTKKKNHQPLGIKNMLNVNNHQIHTKDQIKKYNK